MFDFQAPKPIPSFTTYIHGARCEGEIHFSFWPMLFGGLGTLLGLLSSPYVNSCFEPTMCFLDVVSIHQTDQARASCLAALSIIIRPFEGFTWVCIEAFSGRFRAVFEVLRAIFVCFQAETQRFAAVRSSWSGASMAWAAS